MKTYTHTTINKRKHSAVHGHEIAGVSPVFKAPEPRKPVPLSVVRKMMRKETDETAFGSRVRCARCGSYYLAKFMVLITGASLGRSCFSEPDYVDRLCYNKDSDHKVPSGTRAR